MEKAFELNKALFEAVAACNYEEAERYGRYPYDQPHRQRSLS